MLCKYPEHIMAGDDAVEFRWFNIYNPPPMAFDHKQILESCQGTAIFENLYNNKK